MDQANEAIQDDIITEQPQEVETQEEVTAPEETETEDGESLLETQEPEFVEIERDGVKYSVPKELEGSFMQNKDYTTKTQEVAEQRRALEEQTTQFQQAAQMQQRNMQGHAQLAAMQNQLQQYEGIDWASESEQNPIEANKAFFQYTQLRDGVANLGQQLQSQESQALQQQQTMSARQLEQGKAELARDIKDWSPELVQKLNNHGETYGFSKQEISGINDPRMVKVLNDAMMYRQSMKKATEATPTQVKPVSKVKGKAKGAKDPEKMSSSEWLEWRNKQIASRG